MAHPKSMPQHAVVKVRIIVQLRSQRLELDSDFASGSHRGFEWSHPEVGEGKTGLGVDGEVNSEVNNDASFLGE